MLLFKIELLTAENKLRVTGEGGEAGGGGAGETGDGD